MKTRTKNSNEAHEAPATYSFRPSKELAEMIEDAVQVTGLNKTEIIHESLAIGVKEVIKSKINQFKKDAAKFVDKYS